MRRTGFFSISLPVLTCCRGILRGSREIVNAGDSAAVPQTSLDENESCDSLAAIRALLLPCLIDWIVARLAVQWFLTRQEAQMPGRRYARSAVSIALLVSVIST